MFPGCTIPGKIPGKIPGNFPGTVLKTLHSAYDILALQPRNKAVASMPKDVVCHLRKGFALKLTAPLRAEAAV